MPKNTLFGQQSPPHGVFGLTFDLNGRHCGGMSPQKQDDERIALLQGTLDTLILRILVFGPRHGQGVARAIQERSENVLLVDHGSLYPALQRLQKKGWIDAEWGVSENNRKARFYTLTKTGRTRLSAQTVQWQRLTGAIGRILGTQEA